MPLLSSIALTAGYTASLAVADGVAGCASSRVHIHPRGSLYGMLQNGTPRLGTRVRPGAPVQLVQHKFPAARVHDPLHSAVQVLCPRASTVCACRVSRMCVLCTTGCPCRRSDRT